MLEGKVAIITGATRGIGFQTAYEFLRQKAKVVILGTRKETVEKALEELKQIGKEEDLLGFFPNLINEEEVKAVFQEVEKKFGHIDILINNAGMASKTKFEEYTMEEYDHISNLNIKAVFVCSKVAVPFLKKTEGVILNTSSMVSIYGQPSGVMYPTSKFAINGFTKSLARELAPMKIRVNAVAPGIIETDMVKSLPANLIEPLIQTIPLGRIGTPQDIANAFVFLSSDMASYISGVILQVDGLARS